jgi:hypothetical protein
MDNEEESQNLNELAGTELGIVCYGHINNRKKCFIYLLFIYI